MYWKTKLTRIRNNYSQSDPQRKRLEPTWTHSSCRCRAKSAYLAPWRTLTFTWWLNKCLFMLIIPTTSFAIIFSFWGFNFSKKWTVTAKFFPHVLPNFRSVVLHVQRPVFVLLLLFPCFWVTGTQGRWAVSPFYFILFSPLPYDLWNIGGFSKSIKFLQSPSYIFLCVRTVLN